MSEIVELYNNRGVAFNAEVVEPAEMIARIDNHLGLLSAWHTTKIRKLNSWDKEKPEKAYLTRGGRIRTKQYNEFVLEETYYRNYNDGRDCRIHEFHFKNRMGLFFHLSEFDYYSLRSEFIAGEIPKYVLEDSKGIKTEIPYAAMRYMMLEKGRVW